MNGVAGFVVCGVVEHGDERGRTIGFPTANLPVEQSPALDGVWAGWLEVRGWKYPAAISVGNRSTFYGQDGFRLLEAHVLDFDEDIYDEDVTVWLCERLRDQCAFASVDALVVQLHEDVRRARSWTSTARLADHVPELLQVSLEPGRAIAYAPGI